MDIASTKPLRMKVSQENLAKPAMTFSSIRGVLEFKLLLSTAPLSQESLLIMKIQLSLRQV